MLGTSVTPFTAEQVEDLAARTIRNSSLLERGLLVAYGGNLVAQVTIDAQTETDFQRIFRGCAPAAYRAAVMSMSQPEAVEFQQAIAVSIYQQRQQVYAGGAR